MKYFPNGKEVKVHEGIETKCFEFGEENEYTILSSVLKPGAIVEEHSHRDYQICIVTEGELLINCDGKDFLLKANENALYIPRNVKHSAINNSSKSIKSIDIKKKKAPKHEELSEATLINYTEKKSMKSGIEFSFLVGPWFEIMYSEIPNGGVMPLHGHVQEQIGIGLTGKYDVIVEDEKKDFVNNTIYYAPPYKKHSGFNDNEEMATSFNIFIPKKYNKKVDIS